MSKPIATVEPYGYNYCVVIGGLPVTNTRRDNAEAIAVLINSVQIERDCLRSTCELVAAYFRLLNDPQGTPAKLIFHARHEAEGAVNVAIALSGGEEALANAALFAAAPDLLAALERLVITRQHSALAQARAAIAKAHGEAP